MTAATHRPEDPAAVHSSALSAFLAGQARGIAAVESLPAQPSYAPAHTKGGPSDGSVASEDPENIRRRRWGAGATVPSSSPRAPATPSPSEASWWQKTSWFKDGAADVAPVLADPSGADHGRGGIADASAAKTKRRAQYAVGVAFLASRRVHNQTAAHAALLVAHERNVFSLPLECRCYSRDGRGAEDAAHGHGGVHER